MDKQLLEQAIAYGNKIGGEYSDWLEENEGAKIDFYAIAKNAYIAGATSSSTVKNLEREVERLKALEELHLKFGKLEAFGSDCDEYERLYNIWKPGTFPNENPSGNS